MTPRSRRLRRAAEFTLSDECHARLDELSDQVGEPKSRVVEQAILDYEPPEQDLLED